MLQLTNDTLPMFDENGRHIWGGDLGRVWNDLKPSEWPRP